MANCTLQFINYKLQIANCTLQLQLQFQFPICVLFQLFGACPERHRVALANWEAGKTFPEIIVFIGFLIRSHIPETTTLRTQLSTTTVFYFFTSSTNYYEAQVLISGHCVLFRFFDRSQNLAKSNFLLFLSFFTSGFYSDRTYWKWKFN